MNEKNLLAKLNPEDFDRLQTSIAEHGVLVAVVVDEDGDIIDGHHRAMIADSLGIDYPRDVRTGLTIHQRRILGVDLNLARRHMAEYQKTEVGKKIEPDIRAEAERRQIELAGSRQDRPYGETPQGSRGSTRDRVAETVGLSSGRSYEHNKQAIARIETNAPDLIPDLEAGTIDLKEANREVKAREGEAKKAQRQAEEKARREEAERAKHEADAATRQVLDLAGDPEGNVARAAMRATYNRAVASVYSNLLPLDVTALLDAIGPDHLHEAKRFSVDMRSWLDRFDDGMKPGLRRVL